MLGLGITVFLCSLSAVAAQTPAVATPTIPTSVFTASNSAVSQALATASLTPDLGNPAELSTYPQCAQICNNEVSIIAPDFTNLVEVCGVFFRTQTAACEVASCSNSSDVESMQCLLPKI
ncbi:MAG: hypothetical protein Q9167_001005 [Letrouitia subvulpina]